MDSPFHDPGSFRDPAGRVWLRDGWAYRGVFSPGAHDYQAARDRGILGQLIQNGLLTPHEEIEVPPGDASGIVYCLRQRKIPLISYPWEWPFSMLQDAALLHLDLMEQLIPEGFWLRDASAFNVQFDGRRLVLIDTLSIGRRPPQSPWVAYQQFCSHFLGPLALAAFCDIRLLALWREFLDGVPLDLAVHLLPSLKWYHPGLFFHLTLHSRFIKRYAGKEGFESRAGRWTRLSNSSLLGLIHSLRRAVSRLQWSGKAEFWRDYQKFRPYQEKDLTRKKEYVQEVVRRIKPGTVWDLGGNVGEFSLIAAAEGAFVVSIDSDPSCTEYLYQVRKKEPSLGKVLPLTMNLANPSPGLGWDSRERVSLHDRGPADLVLVLALVHHLVLSSQVPLPLVAEWLSRISGYLLVEFVPPNDPMARRLLSSGTLHHQYSRELFEESFRRFFDFTDKVQLENERILFLGKRK
jgi:hypothetical protein